VVKHLKLTYSLVLDREDNVDDGMARPVPCFPYQICEVEHQTTEVKVKLSQKAEPEERKSAESPDPSYVAFYPRDPLLKCVPKMASDIRARQPASTDDDHVDYSIRFLIVGVNMFEEGFRPETE
jgi:hypothetical protein